MIIHKFGNTKYILSFDFTAYLGIVISICLSSIAIISLLVSLKKEYYLTINIIDIIIDYKIIRMVMSILLDAFFFVILCFCNQFFLKNNISEYSLVIKLFMLSLFIVIVIITLFMLYQTIKICVYNNKRELKNNKVLRFKVADNYIAADSEKYSIVGIRQNINYLIEEIISQYKKAKFSECCFKDVDFYSSILCKANKKYAKESDKDQKELNKKIKYCGSFCVFIVAAIMELMTFYLICLNKANTEKTYIFIQIILTLIIFLVGAYFNIWNLFAANRCVWVFMGIDKKEKIAAFGFVPNFNKRYERIGAIEDLLGLYKVLLYKEDNSKEREIIIDEVKEKLCNNEHQKIGNTILLLLYYFDFEKKKHFYKRQIIKNLRQNITEDSFEYKFADTILKHVNRECKYENGRMLPEILINVKFENYFKNIENLDNRGMRKCTYHTEHRQ